MPEMILDNEQMCEWLRQMNVDPVRIARDSTAVKRAYADAWERYQIDIQRELRAEQMVARAFAAQTERLQAPAPSASITTTDGIDIPVAWWPSTSRRARIDARPANATEPECRQRATATLLDPQLTEAEYAEKVRGPKGMGLTCVHRQPLITPKVKRALLWLAGILILIALADGVRL